MKKYLHYNENLRVSIIIPNFNYAKYISASIESAINVDWSNKEIIVVDDGSTDGSVEIINKYANSLDLVIQKQNGGQRTACDLGYKSATGDIIIFLDSDDVLEPSIAIEAVKLWKEGISKIQVQMKIINALGEKTGSYLPQYDILPSPAFIRKCSREIGIYPSPPGSGNIYSRKYLDQLYDSGIFLNDRASDSFYITAAPFFGEVLTINKPLVGYRVHGANQGAVTGIENNKIHNEVLRIITRFNFSRQIAESQNIYISSNALNKSLYYLSYRTASFAIDKKKHIIEGDNGIKIISDYMIACFIPQGVKIATALALFFWALLVIVAPKKQSEMLISYRFSSVSRPKALRKLIKFMGLVK